MSCSIKICGVTSLEDALMVSEAGADYLGVLVNVSLSPRSLTVKEAREIFNSITCPAVLLTFDLPPERVIEVGRELKPFAIQLAGDESEEDVLKIDTTLSCEIWKTLHITADKKKVGVSAVVNKIKKFTAAGIDRIILDSAVMKGNTMQKGGTGKTFDWSLASEIKTQVKTFIFLAGGITPNNVKEAIVQVNPDGIDLSSGVESSPGKKDPQLVKTLFETVKKAEMSS